MYVLRDKGGVWHVAAKDTGTYVRIGGVDNGITVSNTTAREFAEAILEALG